MRLDIAEDCLEGNKRAQTSFHYSWHGHKVFSLFVAHDLSLMAIIRFRCSDELKARFEEAAKRANLNDSELGRAVFERAFPKKETDSQADKPQESKDTSDAKQYGLRTEKITIRLTEAEHKEVEARGKLLGMGKPTWVMRLIRAHLTKQPQLTDIEVRTLREATRELSYVGRNLNQVAHALNINLNEKDRASAALIAEIHNRVEEMRGQIKAVLDENVNRWGV